MHGLCVAAKACTKCGAFKPDFLFRLRDGAPGSWCRPCHNATTAKWRGENPEKQKAAADKWVALNPERVAAKRRRWHENNPGRSAELAKKYRLQDPEKYREVLKRARARLKNDPKHRIRKRVSYSLRISLNKGKERRGCFSLLGYSPTDLKTHLEKQFTKGMNWDAFMRGEIHIDHITPLSAFKYDSTDCDDFKAAWALTNLRPLWAKDNQVKHTKRLFLI